MSRYISEPDLDLDDLFNDFEYPQNPEFIKSSKAKDAVIHKGYYYNFKRENKREKSSVYKCTESFKDIDGKTKECSGSLKIFDNSEREVEVHSHIEHHF